MQYVASELREDGWVGASFLRRLGDAAQQSAILIEETHEDLEKQVDYIEDLNRIEEQLAVEEQDMLVEARESARSVRKKREQDLESYDVLDDYIFQELGGDPLLDTAREYSREIEAQL